MALALAGCTQYPLAPADPLVVGGAAGKNAESPPILKFSSDGTTDYIQVPADSVLNGLWAAGTPTTRTAAGYAVMDGRRGGTVRAGRFTVQVPPGAFSGVAAVTVSMPDSTVMICDLRISPPAANRFTRPAVLTADLSGLSADAATFTMYWYDPARRAWVNLATKSKTAGTSVSASLDHFSTYGAGKAGW